MNILFKIILVLHVIAGFLSLLTGCISVVTQKGSPKHRLAGKIFFVSMLGVSLSALFLSFVKSSTFLFCIGIFALYQNYAGYRAIKNKSLKTSSLDYVVLVIGTLNSFFMVYSMHPILMIFGGISIIITIGHWRTILMLRRKELSPLAWLQMHIGMMMGAFISAATAFVVVNMQVLAFLNLPVMVIWLFPTLMLAPLAAYWTRKYTSDPEKRMIKD